MMAMYDVFPSLWTLHLWYGSEETWQLCDSQNLSLQLILFGYKTAKTQGWYRWCHDQTQLKLAKILDACKLKANRVSLVITSHHSG